ncbi:SusC/RagA family TonB-linked outer membrane protein [Bacteroidia bacterium]|nr:SusC/RagA family TonB-linked outer membrane protein [Bacteroidia bacterium]
MRKIFFLLLIVTICTEFAFSQNFNVTGTVTDETGEPIIGASVTVKEYPKLGTATNTNGEFALNIPSDAKIVQVRYLGMKNIEVEVAPYIRVIMQNAENQLDEIMVVAYGSAKKQSITGSAVQVSGQNLANKNQAELTKALAGEVAGLQVFNTSGQPGSPAIIRIRGFGSANSSRDPLFVVDRAPYDGDINVINPSDIESVTVLKDASAAALYGSRAANGVILITTKKGSKEKFSIEIDIKRGVNMRLIPFYETISSPERYSELGWEALRNYGMLANGLTTEKTGIFASENIYAATRGIAPIYNMWNCAPNEVIDPVTGKFSGATRKYTPENWADYMFRTGQKTEVNLNFTGGADKVDYYTSFGYLNDEGYALNSDYRRLALRSNLKYQPLKWLKAITNLTYAYTESNHTALVRVGWNIFRSVNYIPPIYPVYQRDADGNKVADTVIGGYKYDYGDIVNNARPFQSGINLVATNQLDINRNAAHNLNANVNFEISFLSNFQFTSLNSFQYYASVTNQLLNPYYGEAKGIGRIYRDNFNNLGLTFSQILAYDKQIDRHNINILAAHETLEYIKQTENIAKYQLSQPNNYELSNAISTQYAESSKLDRSMESYLAQVKYRFNEKYFADLNFRRDGSSRFAKHKWGNFGSIGAAWLITEEDFMQNTRFIDLLKVKASYGILGNENLNLGNETANYYPTQNLYETKNQNGEIAYILYSIGNPDLTWENSRIFNTGIDFGLWNNRLHGELEFFKKCTTNMLFSNQTPTSWGYASEPVNDAELDNTGFEFFLSGKLLDTRDWTIKLLVNGAHYSNKIIRMPQGSNGEKELEIHSLNGQVVVGNGFGWSRGHSIYDYYMREYAGVNPETGQAQWYIYNDDGTKTATTQYSNATLIYAGKSAIPDLTGAFSLNVKYKNLQLNAQFIYGIGGYGYDYVYQLLMGNEVIGSYNWHKDIEQRWTTPGQVTGVPRLSATYDANMNALSSRFLTDMSYLGINNIRLEYTFPLQWISKANIKQCGLWISGDNLYLFTARKGYYPLGTEHGEIGDDYYVPISTVMAGINVKF